MAITGWYAQDFAGNIDFFRTFFKGQILNLCECKTTTIGGRGGATVVKHPIRRCIRWSSTTTVAISIRFLFNTSHHNRRIRWIRELVVEGGPGFRVDWHWGTDAIGVAKMTFRCYGGQTPLLTPGRESVLDLERRCGLDSHFRNHVASVVYCE